MTTPLGNEIDRLREVNAALVACVKKCVEMFGPVERPNTEGATWLANCRAALAKAKEAQ